MDQTRTFLPLPADIAGSAELRPLVERANGWLDEYLTKWPTPASAEWYRAQAGPGESVLGLRVADRHAAVHGVFPVEILADDSRFPSRMLSLLLKLTDAALGAMPVLGGEPVTPAGAA